MSEANHRHHQHGGKDRDSVPHEHYPYWKRAHHDWRFLAAVFLMLLLGVFVCFGILTLGVFFLNSGMGERRRAEGSLKEAEKKYRGIFENAVEGIFQNTPAGRFISANPAMARMLGFDSPEELIRTRNDIERQGYAEPALRFEACGAASAVIDIITILHI